MPFLAACALLSQATAAGIMGGPVTAAGCTFVRSAEELRIEIVKDFKVCPDAVPLKGIGTEAFACSNGVFVRVREKAFVVRIKDREKARKVAELVAGSLF
ncbi:MAG TPA: hypothetical protein VNU44_01735 [Bryobacteraceae bacterium]|jgi:hypothetical protein|nr:hypothetical protein [Bryobacteraceae bacterium]